MNEELLYKIWQGKKILELPLTTQSGESIQIINAGSRNLYSGPDFLEAKIRLGNTEWQGSVEIHVKASDWNLHKHQTDQAYLNVILHVVWENDQDIFDEIGYKIPCLCLKKFIANPNEFISNSNSSFICLPLLADVPFKYLEVMKENCLQKRLAEKTSGVQKLWESNQKNWEETLYQTLAKAMGFQQNAEPMLRLAQSIPLSLIYKYRDSNLRIQALFFGMADLIELFPEKHLIEKLQKEFNFLKIKHQLSDNFINKSQWKYFKLRPHNYPNIRIFELGNLLQNNVNLLSFFLDIQELKSLKIFFEVHPKNKSKPFGEQAFKSILLNAIIPILLLYGKHKGNMSYEKRAMDWLNQLKPEEHFIDKEFTKIGFTPKNAADSQAFIFWWKNYCQLERCIQCELGKFLFSKS